MQSPIKRSLSNQLSITFRLFYGKSWRLFSLIKMMFNPAIKSSFFTSIRRSCRVMSDSSGGTITHVKNPFVKERLPELPEIELIHSSKLDVEPHLHCQETKYGDLDFLVCKDGYILSYIQSHLKKKEPQEAFYGVYYGEDHPLNCYGPVNGKQSLPHARETAILRLIEAFPNIVAKKLCICTDCSRTISIMGRFETWSENGFRSTQNGKFLQTKDTYVALNTALRMKNDIKIRMLYTPKVALSMRNALKLATLASKSKII